MLASVCQSNNATYPHSLQVERFEKGEVYTEGCLKELTKLMDWAPAGMDEYSVNYEGGGTALASPNVLYIGDSLFADLVDAKREFGWTTGTYSMMSVVEVTL